MGRNSDYSRRETRLPELDIVQSVGSALLINKVDPLILAENPAAPTANVERKIESC